MSPITKALEEGYSPEQVLEFLLKSAPALAAPIKKAKSIGYPVRAILDFLGGNENKTYAPHMSESAIHGERTRRENETVKKGLKTGATALAGGYLAGRAIQGLPKAAQGIAGAVSQRGMPNIPGGSTPTPSPPQEGLTQSPATPPIEQPTQQVAPSPSKILQGLGVFDRVKTMTKAGNTPELIAKVIPQFLSPEVRKEVNQLPPLLDLVKGALQEETQPIQQEVQNPIQSRNSPEVPQENISHQENLSTETQPQKIPEENISKEAILPDGQMGTIIEEKQGIAKIKLPNGKTRTQKLDQLHTASPEFTKNVEDLLNSMPDEAKSAPISFIGYNKETRDMPVQFNSSGDFYIYHDVDQELFDKIVSKGGITKTSDPNNPFHAYSSGKESRGAALHEFIKEMEKAGKKFTKFSSKEGYDYFKLFRQAANQIHKNRKRKEPY